MLWTLLGFLFLMLLWHILGYFSDKKAWNKGACPLCEKGFWVSFDIDSSGAVGYKCTFCNNSHWQNGHFNPRKQKGVIRG
jgi:hypothetical protein